MILGLGFMLRSARARIAGFVRGVFGLRCSTFQIFSRRTSLRMALKPFSGSFRDPAGRVYLQNGTAYRGFTLPAANRTSASCIRGCMTHWSAMACLLRHDDLGPLPDQPGAITIIRPEQVPTLLLHPYEWCFSQLRDAALVTLRGAAAGSRVRHVAEGRQRVQSAVSWPAGPF